jgi:5-methylcytosine-specific restriction endonuclease McrA
MAVPAELRRQVIDRAAGRCEYCRLSQENQEATFHVDHVVPASAHGPTDMGNLALACVSCSLRKGARQHVIDPESGEEVRLFNPRVDRWSDHFE